MNNKPLEQALASFDEVESEYVAALQGKGLAFAARGEEAERVAQLRHQLASRGAHLRNAGASIACGWLSKACEECTGTGGSETFSTTLKCHRDCYFCFNHNLADYDVFVRDGCPWEEELQKAAEATGGKMAVVGLSGGEPLLSLEGSLAFLRRVRQLFPGVHTRMYTSGDLLTPQAAHELAQAGLDEMRFSVKLDDPEQTAQTVLDNMAMATQFIDDVMVEMPIVPGTGPRMRDLMRSFDDAGIRGMNLLEFCFPFHNWNEFARRGFLLKNPPFQVMYDYGYSGGLAVAGSEELCLELMLWGLDEKLGFGMHYCSLENKHRSEMRQKNEPARTASPLIEFDQGDFFLKSARVFGDDCEIARPLLQAAGCMLLVDDQEEQSLTFPPRFARVLNGSGVQVMSVFYVAESDEQGGYLSEVALKPYTE